MRPNPTTVSEICINAFGQIVYIKSFFAIAQLTRIFESPAVLPGLTGAGEGLKASIMRTRGANRREARQAKEPEPASAACDSTVRQWGRPPAPGRRYRRIKATGDAGGVPWFDMPDSALYKVFDLLLQDKQGLDAVSRRACLKLMSRYTDMRGLKASCRCCGALQRPQ